jgi:hypothetical protein
MGAEDRPIDANQTLVCINDHASTRNTRCRNERTEEWPAEHYGSWREFPNEVPERLGQPGRNGALKGYVVPSDKARCKIGEPQMLQRTPLPVVLERTGQQRRAFRHIE